jgi:hypothetical protein
MPNFLGINQNLDAFLPALMAIDKTLEGLTVDLPEGSTGLQISAINALQHLRTRTKLYAMAVKQWPVEDLKYVPNPVKWYSESRFEQNEATWQRRPINGFEQERNQISRIIQ